MSHPLPALITMLCVALQLGVMMNVGKWRSKHKIMAPACTGHPDVERALRIQMNTVESTLMFLPSLWVFAFYIGDRWAGIVGAAWLIGRVIYSIGYQMAAGKRTAGFLIGFLSILALFFGGLFGAIRALAAS